MRKLGFAVALVAAALFAQGARAEDMGQKTKDTAHEAGGAAQKTGKRWEQAGDRAVNGKGSAGSSEHAAQGTAEKKSMFDGKKNFDVDGKIAKMSDDTLTISREDLPPVELKVSHETKIELDGDRASSQQLKEGQDVKASFNLNKDKVEAVEIKAKRTDAQKDAQKRREDLNKNDMNGPAKK